MTIPTDDNRDLLTVVATITARADTVDEVRALLTSFLEPTRAEDGCVLYTLHQGTEDPAVFVFYENWTSRAALDAHLAGPGLTDGLSTLAPLLAAPPVVVPLARLA